MSYAQTFSARTHALEQAGHDAINRYRDQLIEQRAYLGDNEYPGTNVWETIFGGHDPQKDPVSAAAFNAARQTPEYGRELAAEMNGSMFDNGWGDVLERSATSFMCSAFGNFMANRVLAELGERAAMGTMPALPTPVE